MLKHLYLTNRHDTKISTYCRRVRKETPWSHGFYLWHLSSQRLLCSGYDSFSYVCSFLRWKQKVYLRNCDSSHGISDNLQTLRLCVLVCCGWLGKSLQESCFRISTWREIVLWYILQFLYKWGVFMYWIDKRVLPAMD